MAVYERTARIHAPLEDVWQFHSSPDGLAAVSPRWLELAVERIVDPDGGPTDEFTEGTEVTLSVRPFGIGPRQRWTSRIVSRLRGDSHAEFEDVMLDGPFPRWHHTHRFEAVRGGTRMTDRVEYELPLGLLEGLSWIGWPGFAVVFADRHRRTRAHLE